jgi:hypothetical protein
MTGPTVRLAVGAGLCRADIPALCGCLADLLRDRVAGVVLCDVAATACPDVVTVEALSRLRLIAHRHDARLVIAGAGPALRDLMALLGLARLFTFT